LHAKNIFFRGSIRQPRQIKAVIGTHSASFSFHGYQDSLSTIFLSVEVDNDSVRIHDFTLEATASPPLAFHVDGVISSIRKRTAALDIRASGKAGSIARILGTETPLEGVFTLSGTLSNTLSDPLIEAHLESPAFDTDIGQFRDAAIHLRYGREVLTFDRFGGRHEAGRVEGQAMLDMSEPAYRYRLALDPTTLTLEHLPRTLVGASFPLAGTVTLSGEVSGAGFDELPAHAFLSMTSPSLWISGRRVQHVNGEVLFRNGQVDAAVRNGMADVRITGTLRPDGRADLTADVAVPDIKPVVSLLGDSTAAGAADLTAVLQGPLDHPGLHLTGQIRNLRYRDIPLGHLDLTGSLDPDRVVRMEARLDSAKAVFSTRAELTGTQPLTGTLTTRDLQLSDYIGHDAGLGLDAVLKIEGTLEGTLDAPVLRGNGLVQDLTLRDTRLGNASLAMTLRDHDLSFTVVNPDLTVIADGLVSLTEGYPYDLRMDMKRADLSPVLAILAKRPIELRTGWISGRMKAIGLAAYPDLSTITMALDSLIMRMDDRELHFSAPSTVKLENQLLTVDHLEVEGDFGHILINGIASLLPGELVNLEALMERVQLDFLSPFILSQGTLTGTVDGLFALTGSPDAPVLTGFISSSDVTYTVEEKVNQLGNVSASIAYEDRQFRIPALTLDTPMGSSTATLAYPIDLGWAGQDSTPLEDRYTASVIMDNLAVAPLREFIPALPAGLDGLIHGRIDMNGSTTTPEDMTGMAALDALRLYGLQNELVNTGPIRVRFNVDYADVDAFEVVVRPLHDSSIDQGRITASGRLVYRTKPASPVESDFSVNGRNITMEAFLGLANLDVPLSGTINSRITVTGPASGQAVDARFSMGQVRYNDAAIDSVSGRIVYEYGDLVVHVLQVWMKGDTLLAYGTIPFASEGAPASPTQPGGMAITVEGSNLDLSVLSGIVYDLEHIEGRADVQLSVGGTPAAPRSVGEIRVRDPVLQIRDIQPAFKASALHIQVEGSAFTLQPVEFKAGRGKITLYSRLRFDNLVLADFEANAAMSRAEAELIGSAKLTATGTLSVRGTPQRSQLVSGNTPLMVTGTVMHPLNIGSIILGSDGIIRPAETPAPFLEGMRLDVDIDIPQLFIRNDLANIELEGGLAFSGTAQNPVITGNGTAEEGGTVVYLDTRFTVETGRLEFIRRTPLESFTALIDDPILQLDPEITLLARAPNVRDIYGENYEVTLSLTGRPTQPNLQLTAVPAGDGAAGGSQASLSGPEVVSLLTFGLPGITTTGATEAVAGLGNRAILMATGNSAQRLLKLDEVRIEGDLFRNQETGSPLQVTISKRINQRTQVTLTQLFNSSSDYRLRIGYQLTNFLFIETFTDQISERSQNGIDLKVKFRFR
jgi:autotransporter translocation and assembly factor TamB